MVKLCLVQQLSPSEKQLGIEIFSNNGVTEVNSLRAWELNSIWKE